MKETIKKSIKEYSALIVALILFFAAPYVLRLIDPTTAAFDPGILHTIFIVVVAYAIYQAITWSITKNLWSEIGLFIKQDFNTAFRALDNKTKVLISLGLYFIILLMLVLLTIAVL
ncbi:MULTISPECIES: hypothetical protein [Olivibacter]|uniref:Uncharacterized protein n=1 Tax=Olivibacter jilunii TaxID=985016 RepID=A0ABW6AZ41_9SPHI|nr:hypothetical protein [Pseudosphingobacterium sp.]